MFTAPLKRCTLVTMPVSPPGSPWHRLAAIRAAERAHEDVQYRATEPVVVGESVAQPVWHREHPLSDGHVGRQHMIDGDRSS
jgi:hypothetical protein